MIRFRKLIKIKINHQLKQKLLQWAQRFEEVVWLDSNEYPQKYPTFLGLLAVDAFSSIESNWDGAFSKLDSFQSKNRDWLFGYFSYDLKNDVENLKSLNPDRLGFPDLYFFCPKKVFILFEDYIEIQYLTPFENEWEMDWNHILNTEWPKNYPIFSKSIPIQARTTKIDYYNNVTKMLSHIERGDVYEANYCMEFFAENTSINPCETYFRLNEISKSPFSAFIKLKDLYALCASPERFLKRIGNIVISQPIKGTAKRFPGYTEDTQMAQSLLNDPKERSENIMIADLVRNDLSKIAINGSVKVDELCRVYTFEQVHQLISTISCTVPQNLSDIDIIKNCFPMGSMTGVPKISAMNIIDSLEDFKRGIYSGAIGYFAPNTDFDFNVVIRSILYNATTAYISLPVGGAITVLSQAETEYVECLLKAEAMVKSLNGYLVSF